MATSPPRQPTTIDATRYFTAPSARRGSRRRGPAQLDGAVGKDEHAPLLGRQALERPQHHPASFALEPQERVLHHLLGVVAAVVSLASNANGCLVSRSRDTRRTTRTLGPITCRRWAPS
jgi:hypothetical protein